MATSCASCFFLVILATCTIPAICYSHIRTSNDHVALFVFGDSYFDAGNNNYLANALGRSNYWPFGETFFKHPTGRFCDGRIIPDYIAEYLKLPLIQPYLQPGNDRLEHGVSFASAGAGVLAEMSPGLVLDLHTQLNYFKKVGKQLRKKLGNSEAKTLLSNSLYLFSIGSNDYRAPFSSNFTILQSYSKKVYVGMVMGNLTSVIKEINREGGRKFGFLGLGPLGSVPYTKAIIAKGTSGTVEDLEFLIKLHNKELSKVLGGLETELAGFNHSTLDLYTAESERIKNPSKYGFKDSMVACCGSGPYRGTFLSCGGKGEYELCDDPSEYLFFDAAHPTDKANSQFADVMWSGKHAVTRPYNLKTLVDA